MKSKLLAIWNSIWTDICDTYKRLKVLIIVVGAALIYLEWNKIQEALLVYGGKKQIQSDQKKDAVLATQESQDSEQADALATKAQNEPTPDADWYKDQK
jgi:hypothetical protein